MPPPIPIIDVARPSLSGDKHQRAVQTVSMWVFISFLCCAIAFVVFLAFRFNRVMNERPNQCAIDSAAMQRPENYKPAELYLARLMQSDPKFWRSDDPEFDVDWLPPELGKLHLHEIAISREECTLLWGGGGDDQIAFSLQLHFDPKSSTDSASAYDLSFGGPKCSGSDHFMVAKSDHIDELEFVKRGLAELAREQAAFAAGTEVNVNGEDPVANRQRLLSQHPAIAAQLGYTVPTTRPGITPSPAQ